jgi:hypothetical protein
LFESFPVEEEMIALPVFGYAVAEMISSRFPPSFVDWELSGFSLERA